MERATPDRRIRRTKAQLYAALNQLLAEKPPEEITVTELTRLADVSRGTFYSHYKDVPDMVEQMEAELFAEFAQLMDAYSAKELRQGLGPILEDVFSYIQRSFGPVPVHALKADPAPVQGPSSGKSDPRVERTLFLHRYRTAGILSDLFGGGRGGTDPTLDGGWQNGISPKNGRPH